MAQVLVNEDILNNISKLFQKITGSKEKMTPVLMLSPSNIALNGCSIKVLHNDVLNYSPDMPLYSAEYNGGNI